MVVTRDGPNSEPVALNTETVTLGDGDSAQLPTTLSAPQTPGDVRFRVHLYRSTATDIADPASPPEPYREVRLIVSVKPQGGGEQQ